MTSALALPRGLRSPSWYLPLLLPALPALAQAFRGIDPGRPGTPLLVLLLAVGALLSFGLPALVDSLEPAARKEIGMLRPTWLASLFLVQVPLALGVGQASESTFFPFGGFEDLPHMLFLATCGLLAAIPFGMEFQQRTLAGLLSQPVPRHRWWTLKTSCLAGALVLHGVIYVLALLATGHPAQTPLALLLPLGILLAWATTPWWTLRTRSLLPAIVLAIATPILLAAIVSTAVDALDRYEVIRWKQADTLGAPVLTLLLLAGYATVAPRAARRRWEALEAPDGQPAEMFSMRNRVAGGAGHGVEASKGLLQATSRAKPRPVWIALLAKERRLHSLTLAMLTLTGLLALASLASRSNWWIHDYLQGSQYLLGAATMLLAGALPIAEERRYGTLDTQLLSPASRALQWWLKLLPGLGLAALAGLLLWIGTPDRFSLARPVELASSVLPVLLLFACGFLASSASANGLRAAVAGAGHFMATFGLLGLALITAPQHAENAAGAWRERAFRQPELLRQEVRAMDATELERIQAAAGPGLSPGLALTLGTAGAGAAIPILLALVLARLNFTGPAPTRFRAAGQTATCLGITLVASVATLILGERAGEFDQRARTLAYVQRSLEWEKTLSPAEHLLWQRHPHPQDPFVEVASVPLRSDTPRLPGNASSVDVRFPLTRALRTFLIERARIDEALRDLLKTEAASAPPETSLPSVPDPSRRWMRRYGLIPGTTPGAGSNTNSPPLPR